MPAADSRRSKRARLLLDPINPTYGKPFVRERRAGQREIELMAVAHDQHETAGTAASAKASVGLSERLQRLSRGPGRKASGRGSIHITETAAEPEPSPEPARRGPAPKGTSGRRSSPKPSMTMVPARVAVPELLSARVDLPDRRHPPRSVTGDELPPRPRKFGDGFRLASGARLRTELSTAPRNTGPCRVQGRKAESRPRRFGADSIAWASAIARHSSVPPPDRAGERAVRVNDHPGASFPRRSSLW